MNMNRQTGVTVTVWEILKAKRRCVQGNKLTFKSLHNTEKKSK